MTQMMRRNGKVLLAILGAFLMISFTLPSFFGSNTAPGEQVIGTLNGKNVVARDVTIARSEMQILLMFRLLGTSENKTVLLPLDSTGYINVAFATNDVERATQWFLLYREASKMGISASENEVTDFVSNLRIPAADLAEILNKNSITQGDLRTSLSHGLMIQKLALLSMVASPVSLPEIFDSASRELNKVSVNVATLAVEDRWKKAPTPTAEQIQQQFATYKSVAPTTDADATPVAINGHTYPFGYKYPNRVTIEYLKFNRAALAAAFKPTRDDYEQAYIYYNDHQDEFKKSDNSGNLGVSTQPATRPFEDVRESLVSKQVGQRITRFMSRVTERARTLAGDPWKNSKIDLQGYREPVTQDKWADYTAIAKSIAGTSEFNGFTPQYVRLGQFESQTQLAKATDLGEAYLDTDRARVTLSELALQVKELADPKALASVMHLQVGVEGPLLQDFAGNLYLYRVTAVDASHEPASLDEVKSQVIDDLKKIATYQDLQAQAAKLADAAGTGNLITLAKAKGFTAETTPDLSRSAPTVPGIGNVPHFVNTAFTLADALGTTTRPTTAPAAKAATLPNDATLQVFVLKVDKYSPVTPADFAAQRQKFINQTQFRSGYFFMHDWTSLEAVARRLNYVPKEPFTSAKKEVAS